MTQLKGLGMQDNSNAKIEVVFNEKGQPIGDASKPFASFIGALARNKVHITVDDWKQVSSTQRKDLWTLVLVRLLQYILYLGMKAYINYYSQNTLFFS